MSFSKFFPLDVVNGSWTARNQVRYLCELPEEKEVY
jgi:hypothetical protein